MKLSSFTAYVKQLWKNKPDTSTPLSAERLTHMEEGIKGNSDAIEAIAAAVVSQIVNDPDKIASMAALYSVNQKIGDVSKLPDSAADVVTAIAKQNSNLETLGTNKLNTDNHISEVVLNADNNGVTFTIDGVPYTSPIMVAGKSITRMEIDTTLSKLTLVFFYDGQIIKRYASLSAS